jgi:hypothetical protein
MPRLRDGSSSRDPRLSRVPWFDDASRRYPIRERLDARAELRSKTWRCTVYLDQKRQGACSGFAAAHAVAAAPHMLRTGIDEKFARETVYFAAQKLDPFPGGAYPGAKVFTAGSTILASMKIVQRLGYIAEYRWAFGVDEVCRTIAQIGPVVLGLPWYEGMRDPACCGMLHPTGRRIGAHAILARGVDVRRKTVLVHNSFGRKWGRGGTALIHWDDLAFLLDGSKDGEACVPIKRIP